MSKIRFVLGGEEFNLSKGEVEQALKHIGSDEVRKYYVEVHGRRYPVKQALAVAINRPTSRFISTDATRVLRHLGFQVERLGSRPEQARTESELMFEEYLTSQGLGFFEFEPSIAGASARPDYRLKLNSGPVLFEVKEFRPDPALFQNLRGGAYDPYGAIREKIQAGRKKFKELKELPCCLVLYNFGHPHVDLSWEIVYGAMLGNLGYQFPVDTETGIGNPDRMTRAFHGGGLMFRYEGGDAIAAQNTTISAVIAVGHLQLGMRRLSAHIDRIKAASGGEIGFEEVWRTTQESQGTERDASLRQLRVRVYENPFPRIPLTREIFGGPFDERYGKTDDGKITRLFAGQEILNLEKEEADARSALSEALSKARNAAIREG